MIFFPLMADSVIFYVGEAEVYRSIRLKEGKEFRIGGLPADMSNFRVWSSSGYVASYSLQDTSLPSDRERYDSLRSVLRLVKRKLSRVNARYGRLKFEKDFLLSYVNKDVREPAKNLLAMSRIVESNLTAMDSLKGVSDSLKRLEKLLQRQLGEIEAPQQVLTVRLKGFKGGKLFVAYRVAAAWSPSYVFRAYPNNGTLRMEVVALINNYSSLPIVTGRAVVTTAPPPTASVPQHRKWVLSTQPVYPPPPVPSPRYRAKALEEEVAAVPEYSAPVMPSFTYISTRYEYRGEVRIPERDKATGQIPLFKKRYKVAYFTAAYPELQRRAYINAVFTPDQDLAPGDAKVYLDDELAATYRYDGGQRGTPDTLFAGYDPFITGEVNLISQKRKDRKKGKKLFTVEMRVENVIVKNRRKVKVPVVIYARKPFAGGKVNIHYVKFKPKPEKDMGDGLMMWRVEVDPGGKFVIRREMRVEYPKGARLNW